MNIYHPEQQIVGYTISVDMLQFAPFNLRVEILFNQVCCLYKL